MSIKGRSNDSIKSKISATGDQLPKLHNTRVPVRSHSASIRKPTHSKNLSNNRPATVSSVSFSSIPEKVTQAAVESTTGLQSEVNRALEKYRESAMNLPQAETVSEGIEMQLAALHERLQVSQLLLNCTKCEMENIIFEKNDKSKSDLDQHKMGAAALTSGIGQYQKTLNEVTSVMDRVQKMNSFHDTSGLKQRSLLDK